MNTRTFALLTSTLCLTLSTAAVGGGPETDNAAEKRATSAQEFTVAGLKGNLQYQRMTLPPKGGWKEVITVPEERYFVLTHFCRESDRVQFWIEHFGYITVNPTGCTTFYPGFEMKPGQRVMCNNTGVSPLTCEASGLLTK